MIRNDDVFGTLVSCGEGHSTKSPSTMRTMLSASITFQRMMIRRSVS